MAVMKVGLKVLQTVEMTADSKVATMVEMKVVLRAVMTADSKAPQKGEPMVD